jgi:hypothetical protein
VSNAAPEWQAGRFGFSKLGVGGGLSTQGRGLLEGIPRIAISVASPHRIVVRLRWGVQRTPQVAAGKEMSLPVVFCATLLFATCENHLPLANISKLSEAI